MTAATARAPLFVPGDRPDRFLKAARSGTDLVIVDLEDAVAADQKDQAREAALDWFAGTGPAGAVRVNAPGTPWFDADLEAVVEVKSPLTILLPKCDTPEIAADVVGRLPGSVTVVVLVETAVGLSHCAEIAAVPGVARLVLGTVDLALDLGLRVTGHCEPELAAARSAVVLASRVVGLPAPIDGVFVDVADADGFAVHAQRSRSFGFGGVLCVHPRQVAIAHGCFQPTDEEVLWARRVTQAAKRSGGRVVRVGNEMVDLPVVERAHRILAGRHREED